MTGSNHSPTPSSTHSTPSGAGAAAAPSSASLRPLLLRFAIGALAIAGLSGIGAVSMLAGLEGAHASPPEASSVWMAASAVPAPPKSEVAPRAAASSPATEPSSPTPATPDTASGSCPLVTDDGKVILNRADITTLRKIPGIGPKRAEAILALRARLKRFRRPAELLRVKGIGAKSLVRMQPHFVLDDPKNKDCGAALPAK